MFLVRGNKETNPKYLNRSPFKRVRTEGSSNDGSMCKQQMFVKQLYHISEKHGGGSIASEKPTMILSTCSSDSSGPIETPKSTPQILPKRKFGDKVKIHISSGTKKDSEEVNAVEHCAAFESWSSFWNCGDFLVSRNEKDVELQEIDRNERKRRDLGRVPSTIFFSCNPSQPLPSESNDEDSLVAIPSSTKMRNEGETLDSDGIDDLMYPFNEGIFRKIGEETSIVESYLDNVWVISSYNEPNTRSNIVLHGEMSIDSSILTRNSHRL